MSEENYTPLSDKNYKITPLFEKKFTAEWTMATAYIKRDWNIIKDYLERAKNDEGED